MIVLVSVVPHHHLFPSSTVYLCVLLFLQTPYSGTWPICCHQRPKIDDQTNLWFIANPGCGWAKSASVLNPLPREAGASSAPPALPDDYGEDDEAALNDRRGPALCPLPLITHSVGILFKASSAQRKAFADAQVASKCAARWLRFAHLGCGSLQHGV